MRSPIQTILQNNTTECFAVPLTPRLTIYFKGYYGEERIISGDIFSLMEKYQAGADSLMNLILNGTLNISYEVDAFIPVVRRIHGSVFQGKKDVTMKISELNEGNNPEELKESDNSTSIGDTVVMITKPTTPEDKVEESPDTTPEKNETDAPTENLVAVTENTDSATETAVENIDKLSATVIAEDKVDADKAEAQVTEKDPTEVPTAGASTTEETIETKAAPKKRATKKIKVD